MSNVYLEHSTTFNSNIQFSLSNPKAYNANSSLAIF